MKKLTYIITSLLLAALLTASVSAAKYPSSKTSVPDGSKLLTGEIIGEERGWDGSRSTGSASAFDGNRDTYYDPTSGGDENCYCGIELEERFVLTKVCILPRDGQLVRFEGASIQGSFDGEDWVTLWESGSAAFDWDWQTITDFEANVGYSCYRYFNAVNHGDVAEVELYGYAGALSEDPSITNGRYEVGEMTVLFDPQNGKATVRQNAVFGGRYPEAGFVPEKDGFVFGGWYLYPEGGVKITPETTVTRLSSHTLYARWLTSEQAQSIASSDTSKTAAQTDGSGLKEDNTTRNICLSIIAISVVMTVGYILVSRKKA